MKLAFIKKNIYVFNKNFFNRVVLILIVLIILISWFKSQTMLASAEEGLPFYNLSRSLEIYTSYFYDTGLGWNGALNIPRIPLFSLFVLLERIGLVSWQIQMFMFGMLIITPLLTMPKLIRETIPDVNEDVGFIVSLFYLFNLYVLSQVLTRFVYPLIFLWSYLPLFLLLWILYLKTNKIKHLFFLLLTTFIFSDMFVIISPLIVLWFCAGLYFFIRLFKDMNKLILIRSAVIAFVMWICTNLWWLLPLWQTRNITNGSDINASLNYESLSEVSKYFPNSAIWLLRQLFLFGNQSGRPFYTFYENQKAYNLSTGILVIVIFGVIVCIRKIADKKTANLVKSGYLYFLLLLVLGWFISKGTNPPFGKEFYLFFFNNIPILQIFRNPYEKFGVVFVLAYAVMFSVGVVQFAERFKKMKYVIIFVTLFLFCGYLVRPVWSGHLFSGTQHVIVPAYYESVNDYIVNHNSTDARLFQLPFLRASIITYDWNYSGEESSEFLFNRASVSRTASNEQLDSFYLKLGDPTYFRKNKNFSKLLAVMDVDYIILHKDEVLSPYYQEGVDDTRTYINNWKGVKHVYDSGQLEVYKLNDSLVPGRVYIVDKLLPASNLDKTFAIITNDSFNSINDTVYVPTNKNKNIAKERFIKPRYHLVRLSNIYYQVNIIKNTGPFVLVLANNFNSVWSAKIGNTLLNDHFMVNGYANGWLIEKKGTYTIDIIYKVFPWN